MTKTNYIKVAENKVLGYKTQRKHYKPRNRSCSCRHQIAFYIPKKPFFSSGSFFLPTQAEERAFSQLKAFISAQVSKKKKKRTALKEPVRTAIL